MGNLSRHLKIKPDLALRKPRQNATQINQQLKVGKTKVDTQISSQVSGSLCVICVLGTPLIERFSHKEDGDRLLMPTVGARRRDIVIYLPSSYHP